MRTKIRVDTNWYKPVPWHSEGECDGCVFDGSGCINASSKFSGLCDAEHEFEGMIFIPNTKAALAEYVVRRLEGPEEDDE